MNEKERKLLQKDVFLQTEGDAWYQRNAAGRPMMGDDPVLLAVQEIGLHPQTVLEIGCANGQRLQHFREQFGCRCMGIDPSRQAIADGSRLFPEANLQVGTADDLPFPDNQFDMVIFGFCLYLVDPDLYFRVVYEADRVLSEKGYIVIYDFLEPFPFHREYHHHTGVKSYKMEFSRLFLAHPFYMLAHRIIPRTANYPGTPDNRVAIDILVRNKDIAFPPSPYSPMK